MSSVQFARDLITGAFFADPHPGAGVPGHLPDWWGVGSWCRIIDTILWLYLAVCWIIAFVLGVCNREPCPVINNVFSFVILSS